MSQLDDALEFLNWVDKDYMSSQCKDLKLLDWEDRDKNEESLIPSQLIEQQKPIKAEPSPQGIGTRWVRYYREINEEFVMRLLGAGFFGWSPFVWRLPSRRLPHRTTSKDQASGNVTGLVPDKVDCGIALVGSGTFGNPLQKIKKTKVDCCAGANYCPVKSQRTLQEIRSRIYRPSLETNKTRSLAMN